MRVTERIQRDDVAYESRYQGEKDVRIRSTSHLYRRPVRLALAVLDLGTDGRDPLPPSLDQSKQ